MNQRLIGVSLAAAFVTACVALGTLGPVKNYHRTQEIAGAVAQGAGECRTCHEDVMGRGPIAAYHADCEACHGPGSVHNESEKVEDIRHPSSEDCLSCHQAGRTTHLGWDTSDHMRAGLLCSDCHNPHNREPANVRLAANAAFPRMLPKSSTCLDCHADVVGRLNLPSHHPVREGMVSCVDCHDPHADSRTQLGHPTAQCTSCHQDYAGPWVYEHAPAAENCTTCHNPHGSASFKLIEPSQPGLCLSCHTLSDDRHGTTNTGEGIPTGGPTTAAIAGAMFGRCTDCHAAIHGSHQDPHLRK